MRSFWRGECVKLRAVEPSDAESFYQWNQDSERARNLDFVWPPTSRAFVKAWVEKQSTKKLENDAFHWVIENSKGVPVGSISTHGCNRRNGTFSYGIDIASEHQRNGYASAAIQLVLKYYFEELGYQKANVRVSDHNTASIRLHERLGFQQEGLLRRTVFTRGQYHDVVCLGMTVEEFRQLEEPEAAAEFQSAEE